MRTVIHRDRTFEYRGRRFCVIYGGPGWGYEIVTFPQLRQVEDGFHTLGDVRAFVDQARSEGWDLDPAYFA